jgi:Kazal-type serine protease inhibitor domain
MQKILFVLLVVAPPVFADSAICTREYAPVCGEYKGEKKTYPTRCVMKNAKAKWLSDGACPAPTTAKKKPAE